MNLTKIEAEKICNEYNLGKLRSFKLIKGGLINHNFILITNKRKFVVRILGQNLDNWKKECLKLQFDVLAFLEKNKFPYKIPKPIKNTQGKEIFSINNKNLWVYEFIEGKPLSYGNMNNNTLMEIAKSIALYHKIIKKLKVKFGKEVGFRGWIYEGIEKMKNSQEKIAKENVELFKKIIDKMSEIKFQQNPLANHRDFNVGNLLLQKEKIIAVIDFDNVEVRPRVNDLATSMEYNCFTKNKFDKKKMKLFLQTYKKYNGLTSEEEKIIPMYMLQEICAEFRWFYDTMKKEKEKRHKYMKNALNRIKEVNKSFNLKF